MSLSPVNQLTNPPLLGKLLASSANDCAATVEFVIALESNPATDKEYDFKASPNGTNCSPNAVISFSPANQPAKPPELGSLEANSAKDIAAVADAVTASASIPLIASEYSFILAPNGTNSSANAARLFSPVN